MLDGMLKWLDSWVNEVEELDRQGYLIIAMIVLVLVGLFLLARHFINL